MTRTLGLDNYQFYLGPPRPTSRGVFFGANTLVDVEQVEGLTDLTVQFSDQQHLLQHGDIPGIHLATAQTTRFALEIRKAGRTDAAWREHIAEVEEGFSVQRVDELELHWKFPGETERFARCRPVRRQRIIDPDSELGICAIEVEVRRADPRWYATALRRTVANRGDFRIVGEGSSEAYPFITFHTGPNNSRATLYNATTGTRIDVVNGYGVDKVGYADMDKYVRGDQGFIVWDHNGVNQYPQWRPPRKPFSIAPGTNQVHLLFAQRVEIEWRDTYL